MKQRPYSLPPPPHALSLSPLFLSPPVSPPDPPSPPLCSGSLSDGPGSPLNLYTGPPRWDQTLSCSSRWNIYDPDGTALVERLVQRCNMKDGGKISEGSWRLMVKELQRFYRSAAAEHVRYVSVFYFFFFFISFSFKSQINNVSEGWVRTQSNTLKRFCLRKSTAVCHKHHVDISNIIALTKH